MPDIRTSFPRDQQSHDPELETKLRDVVGLCVDPPADAVVVSVDENSQIQSAGSDPADSAAAPKHPRTADPRNIDSYNQRATPFAWAKTADELLSKIKRKSINNTQH